MEFIIYPWCALSLGTPFLTTLYVQQLGKCVGLKSVGENGDVLKNNEIVAIDGSTDYFIQNVQFSGVFPIFTIFGPFAIPISLLFGLCASVNFLVYVVRQYTRSPSLPPPPPE